MRVIRVSAPGKIHLLGEHVVVYGKPAIITAVNKRCFVEVVPNKIKKIKIVCYNPLLYTRHSGKRSASRIAKRSERFWTSQNDEDNIHASGVFIEKEILRKTEHARKQWGSYIKTNNNAILKSITPNLLDYIIICIGETLRYFNKKLPSGFTLSVRSDIPVGSGMGSSAALAVSISGAVSLLFSNKLNKEMINYIAFLSEQKIHGFPSGGDNSVSCFGGLIWYRKETPDLKIIKKVTFSFPKELAKNFVAIHTGIPSESTGEMVSVVRNLYKKKPEFVESILSSQEKLTKELLYAIRDSDDTLMIRIIRAGEKNLESLGVVSDSAKLLIRAIEKIGGVAKICGAGGKNNGSGIVLAYHSSDKTTIENLSKSYNFNSMKLSLGAEGLRQEKYE